MQCRCFVSFLYWKKPLPKTIRTNCFPENITEIWSQFHCVSEILHSNSFLNSSLYLFIGFAKANMPNMVRLFICERIPQIESSLTFFLALHLVKHWFLLSHPKACYLILPLPTFLLSLHASVCCLYSSNYLFNCLPFSSILESSRIKPTILQDSAVPVFLSNRWGSKQSNSLLSPNLWASSNLHCWIYLQHASVCMPASTVSWISIESFFISWNCQLVLHIKVLPMWNKYSSEIN